MKKDHYSILGVTPASGDAEIRGAYRSLMRRYHPDADPSAEAAEKAREINEAYRVLGDPDRRSRYDAELAASNPLKFDPERRPIDEENRGSRAAPVLAFAVAVAAAGMIAFAISPSVREFVTPTEVTRPVAIANAVPITPAPKVAAKPAEACTDAAAGDLIKDEIIRQASARGSTDREKLDRVASLAHVRVASKDGEGSSCSAWLRLDLPRGLVVDGGRTNLNADIAFKLVAGSDGLRLQALSGVAPLVHSLSTLSPEPEEPATVQAVETREIASLAKPKPIAVALPKPRSSPTVQASPPCSAIDKRSDKMICESDNLASLDRQLDLLYPQSWKQADEKKKAALIGTRQRFNDRRDACGSPNCMTTAYVSRLREISDIMAGRVQQ